LDKNAGLSCSYGVGWVLITGSSERAKEVQLIEYHFSRRTHFSGVIRLYKVGQKKFYMFYRKYSNWKQFF
jgi:hypothetical protein